MTNTNKIYDGDVKARVERAIETYKAKSHCYFNDTMHNCAQEVKNIAELYHATCAWYQGYPANEEEEKNANPEDGSFDHVSEEDLCRIYKYLD